MKKQFLFLVLLGLLCSVGNVWAADGNLPSQPTTSLDLSTQSTYTPDGNGWIVFDPYSIAGSPTWFTFTTKSSQSSGVAYTAEGSEFVAPFVDKASDASSYKINYTGSYSVAVRFTGAEKASFLVCPRSSKSFYVGLYSVNTSTNAETLVEEKPASGSSTYEILYSSLTPSTTYVAYFYGKVKQNMSLMEIALKAPASGPSLAVSPSSASPFTYVVDNGPSAEQTFTIAGSNLTNPISASLSNSAYEMRIGTGEWSDGPLAPESGNVIGVRLKSGKSLGTYNGNLTFSSTGADSKAISLVGSVTNQTYSVTYDLNGASGDAPTEAAKESGASFTLAAAPSRDYYTFTGWLCSADGLVKTAGSSYTMTATATTFTAQWNPIYADGTYDFTAGATVGTEPSKTITTSYAEYSAFRVDELFFSAVSKLAYDAGGSDIKYKGWKFQTSGATIKFMVESDCNVSVTLGANAGCSIKYTPIASTETTEALPTADNTTTTKSVAAGSVITLTTTSTSTVVLKSINIYLGCAANPEAPTALTVGTIKDVKATFTVADEADTDNYEFYVNTSSTAPTASTVATHSSSAKTVEISGLKKETTYYAWVRSVCDPSHKSDWVALTGASFTTTASTACELTNIKFSNGAYGAITTLSKEGTATITVPYLAGQAEPSINEPSIVISEGATKSIVGNTITVTAEDGVTTSTYTITKTAFTPLAVTGNVSTTNFTDVPSWVYNPYGWDDSKGLKFSKKSDEASNMRIAKGFTRQYYFIGAAQSLTLTKKGSTRKVNVYVNGTKVISDTNNDDLGAISLDKSAPCMVMVESNQTGGDGGFESYAIVASTEVTASIGATGWATFSSSYALNFTGKTVKAYMVIGVDGSDVVEVTQVNKVPANTGLLISGTTDDIPVATGDMDDMSYNLMVAGDGSLVAASPTKYVLANQGEPAVLGFYKIASDIAIPYGKAYLDVTSLGAAPSVIRLVDEEHHATNIENVEANEKAIKFIENGRILIKKNGIVYDALGRVIR